MISSLKIKNYALIKELELRLDAGFNIITGETGAGKSIIMGALGLLQGGRSSIKSNLEPGEKTVVEAVFTFDGHIDAQIAATLQREGVTHTEGQCKLRREITASGRGKAFINDEPVGLSALQAIAESLLDIHSQHKNLHLADADFQMEVLDNIASNSDILDSYRKIYTQYKASLQKYASMRDQIENTRDDAEYLQFQLDKLQQYNLLPDEETDLEARRASLEETSRRGTALIEAAKSLSWDDINALQSVDAAIAALGDCGEDDVVDRLETIRTELADIADTVSDKASALNDNPETLEDIDDRLSKLYALFQRHKVRSSNELIAIRDNLQARLDALANAEDVLDELKSNAIELKRKALEVADKLSKRRHAAAEKLTDKIVHDARPLGLANLNCHIQLTTGKLNPFGVDTVDFLFAFNKNQELQPIGKTASGGEISRIMLVLKSILAEYMHLPTIIFDEIDTGVSGEAASRMGELMSRTANYMQVMSITHLPQVAAQGNAHFKVYKNDDENGTHTHIARLSQPERISEIALMLSGDASDKAAIAAATSLLEKSRRLI